MNHYLVKRAECCEGQWVKPAHGHCLILTCSCGEEFSEPSHLQTLVAWGKHSVATIGS